MPKATATNTKNHWQNAQWLRWASLALLALLVLALVHLGWRWTMPSPGVPDAVKTSRYQSVTLRDGRVLFGKLRAGSDGYLRLRDTHVIQQTPATKKQPARPTVVPINEQLTGPESTILVQAEEISSIENLRNDSQVVKAIRRVSGAGAGA